MYKGTPLMPTPSRFSASLQPPFLLRKSQHPTLFQGLWGLNRPVILVTVGAVINDRRVSVQLLSELDGSE